MASANGDDLGFLAAELQYDTLDNGTPASAAGDVTFGCEGASGVGPTITIISPTPGTIPGTRRQAATTPIVLQVTDVTPDLQNVILWLKFNTSAETFVVHDGTSFIAPFDVGSLKTTITNGFQFSIIVTGGWTTNFVLSVKAFDRTGNEV